MKYLRTAGLVVAASGVALAVAFSIRVHQIRSGILGRLHNSEYRLAANLAMFIYPDRKAAHPVFGFIGRSRQYVESGAGTVQVCTLKGPLVFEFEVPAAGKLPGYKVLVYRGLEPCDQTRKGAN
jgi:hypothetical protein